MISDRARRRVVLSAYPGMFPRPERRRRFCGDVRSRAATPGSAFRDWTGARRAARVDEFARGQVTLQPVPALTERLILRQNFFDFFERARGMSAWVISK